MEFTSLAFLKELFAQANWVSELFLQGILTQGEVLIIVIVTLLFLILASLLWKAHSRQSEDFRRALTSIESSQNSRVGEIKEHVASLVSHIESCEQRFENLREDVNHLQRQSMDDHQKLWKQMLEIISELKETIHGHSSG